MTYASMAASHNSESSRVSGTKLKKGRQASGSKEGIGSYRMTSTGGGAPPEDLADATQALRRATSKLIASGIALRAVRAGDIAPHFALEDDSGHLIHLTDLLPRGPVIAAFYWGGWSEYCRLDLLAFQEALPGIQAAGGQLVAISPQAHHYARNMAGRDHLTFPLLSDHKNRVANAFGIRFTVLDDVVEIYNKQGIDLHWINADSSATLPIPARFVIGRDGRILYAEVDPDHTHRSEPRELLTVVRCAPLSA